MAFPAVTLLDSFKREENPLSNGGKWKSVAFLSGGVGRCKESIDWENLAAHDLEGAYWSPGEFTAPCAVAICRDKKINDAGAWLVMACVTHPTTSKFSGYRVMMAHTGTISGTEGKFTVTIERCDEESFTVLSTTTEEVFKEGDRLGIAVKAMSSTGAKRVLEHGKNAPPMLMQRTQRDMPCSGYRVLKTVTRLISKPVQ